MSPLFFKAPDVSQALSRSTVLRTGLLFGPSVLLLVVLRLLQHTLLKTSSTHAIGDILRDSASLPFLLLLVLTFAAVWLCRSRLKPIWQTSGLVLLVTGLFVGTRLVAPPWYTAWLTPQAFQVVRWDLLILLSLALLFLLGSEALRGRLRTLFLGTLHGLIVLLLLLPIFELGTILTMGSPPDGSLLSYTLLHLNELAPVLASEIGPMHLVMLLLPFAITLLPLLVERLPSIRRRLQAGPSRPTGFSWQVVWAAAPLALILVGPPSVALPPTHRTISYAGMTRSFLEDSAWTPDDPGALGTPPFDARALRLVPTDRFEPMNVVVVVLESFRERSVTPYNPELATTPFLDSLAQRSLLVEHMYSVVPYTNKALTPIFSGIYPELSLEVVESRAGGIPGVGLPRLLRPFGYRSAFFTPAKLSFEEKDQLLDNLGFDTMRGDGFYPTNGFFKTHYFGYEDRIMLEPSLAWVDEITRTGQPFFLGYLTLTAHHSYQTPPSFERKPFAPTDKKLNQYLNALHYTDAFLRDLFAAFEERDLIESTLFILLGDHGQAFGEHGLHFHGDILWDEALQVPALLYNPRLFTESGRIEGNRLHTDVVPTVADALGLAIEGGTLPGSSLLQPASSGRILYHSTRHGNQALALRQDSLKFFYYNRRRPMQVFNLRQDPDERHDIAPLLPPEQLKAAEMNLLLWRRGVQQIYHAPASRTAPLATR
ncbi:MAG: LTA synthase family protein [Rhodothermales bacterium]